MSVCCVVVAGGSGQRLGLGPKAFLQIAGRSMVSWAAQGVWDAGVDHVVIVAPAEDDRLPDDVPHRARVITVAGGATRQDSVRAGLAAAPADSDIVLVHDAARCLTPPRVIAAVVAAVRDGHDVVVPGISVSDTLRWRGTAPGAARFAVAPDRERLVAVQTPQGFRRDVLTAAHDQVTGIMATDDATLAERLGYRVFITAGDDRGFKVTRPLDLLLARAYAASLTDAAGLDSSVDADQASPA